MNTRTSVPVTHNTLYQLTKGGCMKIAVIALSVGLLCTSIAGAAELTQQDKGFNWQDREYFGRAYTERQIGGGDSAASGESGDAGAGASGGGAGATGGDSGGNGCGAR